MTAEAEEESDGDDGDKKLKLASPPKHQRSKTDTMLGLRVKTKLYDGPSRLILELPSSDTTSTTNTTTVTLPESNDK